MVFAIVYGHVGFGDRSHCHCGALVFSWNIVVIVCCFWLICSFSLYFSHIQDCSFILENRSTRRVCFDSCLPSIDLYSLDLFSISWMFCSYINSWMDFNFNFAAIGQKITCTQLFYIGSSTSSSSSWRCLIYI